MEFWFANMKTEIPEFLYRTCATSVTSNTATAQIFT